MFDCQMKILGGFACSGASLLYCVSLGKELGPWDDVSLLLFANRIILDSYFTLVSEFSYTK